jgi:hypothetical protein
MTDLTQKLIDDWKPYLEGEHWDIHVREVQAMVERHGPIVNIEKVYRGDRKDGVPGKRLVKKIYQPASAVGTDRGSVLYAPHVGVHSLPED